MNATDQKCHDLAQEGMWLAELASRPWLRNKAMGQGYMQQTAALADRIIALRTQQAQQEADDPACQCMEPGCSVCDCDGQV